MLIISKIKHSHYVIRTQYTVTQVKSETSGDLINGEYMDKINVYFVIIYTHYCCTVTYNYKAKLEELKSENELLQAEGE